MKGKVVDIQNLGDKQNIEIDKVGIKGIKYPILVLDKFHKVQHTIGTFNMYVALPHHFKGTHMSRFIEILNEYQGEINIKNLHLILERMRKRLNARSSHIEVEFPYFIEKKAPVSKAKGIMEYTCKFLGSCSEGERDLCVGVEVPVTTLCPCSREISIKGAHNQRSKVTVKLRFKKFFWIEDLIELIEESASAPVYSLLKRPDERFITELAYENPMFVEDVVRAVAKRLEQDENITWFSVESENIESIHNHNVYALVERVK